MLTLQVPLRMQCGGELTQLFQTSPNQFHGAESVLRI